MTLRNAFLAIAQLGYDHRKDGRQPAQLALKELREELKRTCPPGYYVRVSGSGFSLPVVPWLAILDPDQTRTAQEGIYVVYLYSADLTRLYISLNQGFTAHLERAKKMPRELRGMSVAEVALASVRTETDVLRRELAVPPGSLDGFLGSLEGSIQDIDLGHNGELALGYEAGHITGFGYEIASLPTDEVLLRHMFAVMSLYAAACDISDRHSLLEPDSWTTRSGSLDHKKAAHQPVVPNFDDFRPRDFSDVTVDLPIPPKPRIRTRKHEELIARFGEHARERGLQLTNRNIGKMDLLMLDSTGRQYLVEAKTVLDEGESAVRDAIGQLFAYRHEYYANQNRAEPILVALFNRPVGPLWRGLLAALSIEVIHWNGSSWETTTSLKPLF